MLMGYARVSDNNQNLDLQVDALEMAGRERIKDTVSRTKVDRIGLTVSTLMNVPHFGLLLDIRRQHGKRRAIEQRRRALHARHDGAVTHHITRAAHALQQAHELIVVVETTVLDSKNSCPP